jgi:hypothetical protein
MFHKKWGIFRRFTFLYIKQVEFPKNQPQRPRREKWATGSSGLLAGAMYGGDFVSPMTDTVAVKARQEPWKPANEAKVSSSKLGVCAGLVTQPVKILYLQHHKWPWSQGIDGCRYRLKSLVREEEKKKKKKK